MREEGVVCAVAAGLARVKLNAAGCARCGSCGVCTEKGREAEIEVVALPETQPGDRVVVEIPGPGPATSAVILLLFPLILFFAGLLLGEWLRARGSVALESWFSFLLGLALMAAAYLVAGAYDRHLRRAPDMQPRIVEILAVGEAPPAVGQ